MPREDDPDRLSADDAHILGVESAVITGHTHFADDVLIDDIHYVNSGSWTKSPCAYITADNGELKLHHVSD